jgi:molybdopterin converting factor small subunit
VHVSDLSPSLRQAIRLAREGGLRESATELEERSFAAYPTSSEWLGEVGEAILQFQSHEGTRVPKEAAELLDECRGEIGKVSKGVRMGSNIKVFLYGSLKKDYSGAGVDMPIALNLRSPAPLPEILAALGIPAEKVQVAMVNHHAVSKKTLIRPTDRVALFPMEYPFFSDWKDLR